MKARGEKAQEERTQSAFTVDIAFKSLNKKGEELCGDKVEILHTEHSHIMILADGMGSGVKANILATMTSKILGTMFLRGIQLERCVETIAETLPVCRVRQMAYATFSILQIYKNGQAYLVEFDNPACILIRDGRLMKLQHQEQEIAGRKIWESHFTIEIGDAFILVSDGAINAGIGELLNFGWTWESVADFALREYRKTATAMHLAAAISQACNDLYQSLPGDDTTVAVMRIGERRVVSLMTGPSGDRQDDARMVREFMAEQPAVKIVCGGTSSAVAARELKQELVMTVNHLDESVPPTARIDGIDLVTEGVVTLNRALILLERYTKDEEIDETFFVALDQPDGASALAKILIEQCTDLHLFVGRAVNRAYQNAELPFHLGVRQKLVEQLEDVMKRLGKKVEVNYY